MKKYKGLVVGLTFALVLFPLAASADSVSEMQTKIQVLIRQIKELQDSSRPIQSSNGGQLREEEEPPIPESTRNTDESGRKITSDNQMMVNKTKNSNEERGENKKVKDPVQGNSTSSSMMNRGEGNRSLCAPVIRNLGIGSRGDDVREVQKMLATDPSIFNASTTGFFGPMTAKAMAKFQEKNGIASSTNGFVGPKTRAFFDRECRSPRALEIRNHQENENNMMGTTTQTMSPSGRL